MRFAVTPSALDDGFDEPAIVLAVVGLTLAVSGVVRSLATPADPSVAAFEVFVFLLVPTGLATGGYCLCSADVPIETRWRVARWVSVGIIVACLLGLWIQFSVALGGGTVDDLWSNLTTLATGGSALGFVAGMNVDAARSSTRSAVSPRIGPDSLEFGGSTPERADPSRGGSAPTGDDSDPSRSRSDRSTAESSVDPDRDSIGESETERTPDRGAVAGRDRSAGGDPADSTRDAPLRSRSMAATDEIPAQIPRTAALTLDVLRDDRARVALAIVYDAREPLSVDDLAAAVAERTDERVAEVAIGLRHATLYELEAAHAIEWDPYGDAIAAPKHAIFEEGVREVAALLEPFEPGTR